MIYRLFVFRKGKRMSEENLKITFHYSDVIAGLFTLGIVVAALVIATSETNSWDLKDSLGSGI